MSRYLEAFFRHPIAVLTPLVLAVVASAAYSLAQPREYTASATVWFSPSGPQDASGAVVLPDTSSGAKAVAVFQEFLKSTAFDLRVGRDGKLAEYYAANAPSSTGLGGLLRTLTTKVGLTGRGPGLSGGALDDQVVTAVTSDVVVAASGPQLVSITVKGPSSETVAATATAVYSTFSDEVIAARKAVLQSNVRYYQVSADDARTAVGSADAALSEYLSDHTRSKSQLVSGTDVTENALVDALTQAHQHYQAAVDRLNQSQLALDGVVADAGFHVVDPAQVPGGPVSITRHVLLGAVGGLFVGVLLMLCLLVVLASVDRTLRSAADVERALGLRAAASIPRVKKLASQEI